MLLRIIIIAVTSLILFDRCAQQVSPTGGKKDSIPPTLVQSIPVNKTINFKKNQIELFFDEYVVIDNINQKLIITPASDNPYSYKLLGTSVLLNFKGKFQDSTTYTLNFGDAIKDFAEKLPAKNLKLVFSTGTVLDSGRVYGTVRDILTNKPILDALVSLYHHSDTLDITKQKPYYFSQTDSSGHFAIENIQPNKYRLIAIEDKNRNMLYNPKEERIGFLSNPISVGTDTTDFKINMAISDISQLRLQRTLPKVNDYTMVFNKGIEKVHVTFQSPDTLPYVLDNNQLKFYNSKPHSDSTFVSINITDSLSNDSLFTQKITFLPQRGKEKQAEKLTYKTTPATSQPLTNTFTYQLEFNKPILKLDSAQILLISDSLTKRPLGDFSFHWNNYHTKLNIEARASAKDSIKWQIPKGAIISIEQDSIEALLLKHALLKEEDYGILSGTVLNPDSTYQTIVELVDDQFKTIQRSIGKKYHFKHIPQGKYYLRAITDINNNLRWDTGRIDKNIQPEPVNYHPNLLLIKSNFELTDINISLLPR